jgi:hypothetical protein
VFEGSPELRIRSFPTSTLRDNLRWNCDPVQFSVVQRHWIFTSIGNNYRNLLNNIVALGNNISLKRRAE